MSATLLHAPPTPRACVFTIGSRAFALPVPNVRAVVDFEEWTRVPLAPPHVLGVANLRGEVVPLVDARGVLGVPSGPRGRRLRTVVVAAGDARAAVVVDEVLGLERLDGVQAGPRPAALLDAATLLETLRGYR